MNRDDMFFPILIGVTLVLGLGLFIAMQAGPPDNSKAVRAMENIGFSDVTVVNRSYVSFQCGRGDIVEYTVKATNARGERVTMIVCTGWLKGATVRSP
jgi:hypothetical protein